jgi:hypothetical protein
MMRAVKFIRPAAFIAHHKFVDEIKANNQVVQFTLVRKQFEDFLVSHKIFLSRLGHSKGSRTKPLPAILTMYKAVFEAIGKGITIDSDIIKDLEKYSDLSSIQSPAENDEAEEPVTKNFSKAAVRAKVVSDVLATRSRCAVCGARLPPSCRSKDHINKAEHDGMGTVENLQFTHPFCNSARDAIEAAKAKAASVPVK